MANADAWRTMAWALDFARAMGERPLWARLLFRLAAGRWAFAEFIGMVSSLDHDGYAPLLFYDLDDLDYHQKDLPLDWKKFKEVDILNFK